MSQPRRLPARPLPRFQPLLTPMDEEPSYRFSMSALIDSFLDSPTESSETTESAPSSESTTSESTSESKPPRRALPPIPPSSASLPTPPLTTSPQSSPDAIADPQGSPPTPPSASEFPFVLDRLRRSSVCSVESTSSSSSADSTNSTQSEFSLRRRHHIRRDKRQRPAPPRPLPTIPSYQKPALPHILTSLSGISPTYEAGQEAGDAFRRRKPQPSAHFPAVPPTALPLSALPTSFTDGDRNHEHAHGPPTASVDMLTIDWDHIESALGCERRASTLTRASTMNSVLSRRPSRLSYGPRGAAK